MKLFGSIASPFVRRVRLLLDDYDFEIINIFEQSDREKLLKYSKTRRVPILIDDDKVISDSSLICEYLLNRPLSLNEKLDLNLVNEANNSAVTIFQLVKFEIDPTLENQFSKNQVEILETVLDEFNNKSDIQWELTGMWLYCLLDWLKFRNVYNWEGKYSSLVNFYNSKKDLPKIKLTDPRGNL